MMGTGLFMAGGFFFIFPFCTIMQYFFQVLVEAQLSKS